MDRPPQVSLTAQEDGHLLALNYHDTPSPVSLPGQFDVRIPPYGIVRLPLNVPAK